MNEYEVAYKELRKTVDQMDKIQLAAIDATVALIEGITAKLPEELATIVVALVSMKYMKDNL